MENLILLTIILALSFVTGIMLLLRRYNTLSEFAIEPLILVTVFMVPVFAIFSYFPFLAQDNFLFVIVYFVPLMTWVIIVFFKHREEPHERRALRNTIIGMFIALTVFGIFLWQFILNV